MKTYKVYWWSDDGAPTQQREGLPLRKAKELYRCHIGVGHHAIVEDAAGTWWLDPEKIQEDPAEPEETARGMVIIENEIARWENFAHECEEAGDSREEYACSTAARVLKDVRQALLESTLL